MVASSWWFQLVWSSMVQREIQESLFYMVSVAQSVILNLQWAKIQFLFHGFVAHWIAPTAKSTSIAIAPWPNIVNMMASRPSQRGPWNYLKCRQCFFGSLPLPNSIWHLIHEFLLQVSNVLYRDNKSLQLKSLAYCQAQINCQQHLQDYGHLG